MLKNSAAACVLVVLFAVALYGIWLSSKQPPYRQAVTRSDQPASQQIRPETPEERIADYTEVLAWFTGLLALVSATQIAFLIKADKTARTAADAAKDAVVLSGKAAERQLRAYLSINPDTIPKLDSDDPTVEIIIKNTGETPAYKIGSWVSIEIAPYPPTALAVRDGQKRSTLPKSNHHRMFTNLERPLTDAEKVAILDGSHVRLYVWGAVNYTDAFDVPRFNHFRFEFGGSDALRHSRMIVCEIGNDEN